MRIIQITALIGLAACATVDSEDVKTSGMYADLWAMAEGDGTSRAVATLRVGGETSNTFVELTGEDSLTATRTEEDPVNMDGHDLLGAWSYRADFPDDTPDLDITVAFTRPDGDDAPNSVMSLPMGFTVDPIDTEYSRDDDDIVLTWDNQQAEQVAVLVEGSCIINQYPARETDAGTWTIPADSIEPNVGEEMENCEIELSVWRSRPGTVDSGYGEGGAAWGHQVRKVTALSTP